MAMSRFLSQSLPHSSPHYLATALMSHHRHHSSKSRRAQLNEVTEIDQASSSSADPGGEAAIEIIALGIKRIEDAIHNIIVRRSAPDWLPFSPGPRTGSRPVPPPCAEAAPLPNTTPKA
ncbi:hypothetical protein PHJA_001219200 [Phtheirospermum japonicum]|uniref:Uncharacterized protein n=1 Tax=Phtheirospermum japonicum TaxID=374723 RepID=A0A830C3K1_9LAMI|nr:hypothetical protein PHJA_001219200 [Phtheirospermum japonicum]